MDGDFYHLSVIGDKSVYLFFYVADLSIYRCRKSFFDVFDYRLLIKLFKRLFKFFRRAIYTVTERLVRAEHVRSFFVAVTAELGKHDRALALRHFYRLEVNVQALDIGIAYALVIPTADGIDNSRRVERPYLLGGNFGIELSPTLVEGNPSAEAYAVFEVIHFRFHFRIIFRPALFVVTGKLFIIALCILCRKI